ncbi:MAG TPA: glycosyltransferase family 4 protein [Candidatus Paceibacterota bacterium]|nr:glycosyltransferase family 4 protein [Candidatus Paceibacterota bacterium]
MKRVLIFSLAYYPSHVSGAEAAIKEITDRISPEAIEFHLVTLLFDATAPRKERIGNVWVYRVGIGGAFLSKVLFIPLAALKARTLHRKLRFDALWAMMTYMLFPVVLARVLGVRVPHILTLQDGDPYEKVFERPFIRPIAFLLDHGFRTAACVQAISKHLAAWPARRGYRGEVVLVHNGANPKDLHESVPAEEIRATAKQLGKGEDDIFLINTARLVHQKANDDTIRALPLLPAHVKLVLVGGGPEEGMLRDLARECGVLDRVIFTGPVDRSEVTRYRRAADIFVGPSRSEGLGNAFLSAMASRLPVVTTRAGGLAEFVFDESSGMQTAWVVGVGKPAQIAARVNEILSNPDTVKRVTSQARTLVEENYDWDRVAKTMQEKVFTPVFSHVA